VGTGVINSLISPKFPHVPLAGSLGLGGWPLGLGVRRAATKSEGVGLIVRAISFQDFQPSE